MMEERVGVARRHHDVFDSADLLFVFHNEFHRFSQTPIGIGCFRGDFVIETERMNGKDDVQKLLSVTLLNQFGSFVSVGRTLFPRLD